MTSTALQTPLERPSNRPQFDIAGVKIFAARDGDQVTGRVDFPYTVSSRSSVPIRYASTRDEPRTLTTLPGRNAGKRLALVQEWERLCRENPASTRAVIAERVIKDAGVKCSLRSLEVWAKSFRLEGAAGLNDQYTPRPRNTLSITGELAAEAIKVCAWWAFRIGNTEVIDSKMMHTAAALLDRGAQTRDGKLLYFAGPILSVIDRYFSWPCDRRKMPFKPFGRWAKYDYDKWLLRAADLQVQEGAATAVDPAYHDGNFQNPHEAFTAAPVAIHRPVDSVPAGLRSSVPPPSKTRGRDARDRATGQAIKALSPTQSTDPVLPILAPLDDAYRSMLLRASFKDKDAIREAVATLPIWWVSVALPAETRERIDRVTFIKPSERRPGVEPKIAQAKVQMFLSELRLLRKGGK